MIYEFWYDYVKPKCKEKVKLCYMHTNSFIVYIKTENIAEDVYTRFDNSSYELECNSIDWPLPKVKNNKYDCRVPQHLKVEVAE